MSHRRVADLVVDLGEGADAAGARPGGPGNSLSALIPVEGEVQDADLSCWMSLGLMRISLTLEELAPAPIWTAPTDLHNPPPGPQQRPCVIPRLLERGGMEWGKVVVEAGGDEGGERKAAPSLWQPTHITLTHPPPTLPSFYQGPPAQLYPPPRSSPFRPSGSLPSSLHLHLPPRPLPLHPRGCCHVLPSFCPSGEKRVEGRGGESGKWEVGSGEEACQVDKGSQRVFRPTLDFPT